MRSFCFATNVIPQLLGETVKRRREEQGNKRTGGQPTNIDNLTFSEVTTELLMTSVNRIECKISSTVYSSDTNINLREVAQFKY